MLERLIVLFASIGQPVCHMLIGLGQITLFFGQVCKTATRPPWRWGLLLRQAESIGIGSLFIVLLTALFTGGVFTLQSIQALAKVGMESLIGSTVMLAVTRELAPVLTALMVTGRVASAMATELGTMRVTEQIDALDAMAIDPLQYLVLPRIVASCCMVPCLCILFDLVAGLGGYVVAVHSLGVDEGAYIARIRWYMDPSDVLHGFIKSMLYGLVLALIGCYQGFYATGGARGVGQATTETVVLSSIAIFVLDYGLTAVLIQLLHSK